MSVPADVVMARAEILARWRPYVGSERALRIARGEEEPPEVRPEYVVGDPVPLASIATPKPLYPWLDVSSPHCPWCGQPTFRGKPCVAHDDLDDLRDD